MLLVKLSRLLLCKILVVGRSKHIAAPNDKKMD